jgi:hypothetical protein
MRKQANGMLSIEGQLKLWMTINCVAWCTWIITYNVHATNQLCCECSSMSISFVVKIVIVWSINSSTSQYGNEINIFKTSNVYNVNYCIKYPHYEKIKDFVIGFANIFLRCNEELQLMILIQCEWCWTSWSNCNTHPKVVYGIVYY